MGDRLFLVNLEPPELRVAEVRNGQLFDLDIERDGRMLGNIYKGRVENVLPGMDAAFVNIGEKRNALLYVGDVVAEGTRGQTIGDVLKVGQEVLVQVARPALGGKGARITTRLSLPGRYAILITNSETAGVSKRIEAEEERARLRRLADKLRPLDHGLILRTEAEGVSEQHLNHDIQLLLQQLAQIQSAGRAGAPKLLHRDLGLLGRLARDRMSADVSAIHIDSLETLEMLREQFRTFAPLMADRLHLYKDSEPIFARFGVQKQVESAALHNVPLPHGGSVVIDEAEALTAIDVNTGKFVGKKGLGDTVLQTNLEAVEEISRQLRLRDIGGIIVVDFIDMEKTRDRVKVLNALEAAVKDDRAKTRIVQISPSGLVEMTRRRESQPLRSVLWEPCSVCEGQGYLPRVSTLAIEARRQLRQKAMAHPDSAVLAMLHPEVACDLLGEDGEWIKDMEEHTGARIYVRANPTFARDKYHFERLVPGLALSGDLMEGSVHPLEPGAIFHPPDAPYYALMGSVMVSIPGLENVDPASKPLVKIVAMTRHFARGKLSGT